MDKAESLSEDRVGRISPTGLLDDDAGQSWYLEAPDCNCRFTNDGLFSEDPRMVSFESLEA